jgi:ABC-type nitrate/sulfonate/bicarbonate transport system ATPase subunit
VRAFVEIAELGKTYQTPHGLAVIVRDFSLYVGQGEFVCLLGHSGCGKTTVLSILMGLVAPTAGGVVIDGREVDGPGTDRGVVFQSATLLPWMSAAGNVRLALDQVGAPASRADTYLASVGLAGQGGRYPRELSAGMQQRVGIARAFALEPRLLLLDEPFSLLDALTRMELQDELIGLWETARRTDGGLASPAGGPAPGRAAAHKTVVVLASDGGAPAPRRPAARKTVIMVTHDVDEALLLADRIVMMTNGPASTIGRIFDVPFPRPRSRDELLARPDYFWLRDSVVAFLEEQAHAPA